MATPTYLLTIVIGDTPIFYGNFTVDSDNFVKTFNEVDKYGNIINATILDPVSFPNPSVPGTQLGTADGFYSYDNQFLLYSLTNPNPVPTNPSIGGFMTGGVMVNKMSYFQTVGSPGYTPNVVEFNLYDDGNSMNNNTAVTGDGVTANGAGLIYTGGQQINSIFFITL